MDDITPHFPIPSRMTREQYIAAMRRWLETYSEGEVQDLLEFRAMSTTMTFLSERRADFPLKPKAEHSAGTSLRPVAEPRWSPAMDLRRAELRATGMINSQIAETLNQEFGRDFSEDAVIGRNHRKNPAKGSRKRAVSLPSVSLLRD